MLLESIIYDGQAVLVDFIPSKFTTKFDEMLKIVQEDPIAVRPLKEIVFSLIHRL
jgi:hypothetical protein